MAGASSASRVSVLATMAVARATLMPACRRQFRRRGVGGDAVADHLLRALTHVQQGPPAQPRPYQGDQQHWPEDQAHALTNALTLAGQRLTLHVFCVECCRPPLCGHGACAPSVAGAAQSARGRGETKPPAPEGAGGVRAGAPRPRRWCPTRNTEMARSCGPTAPSGFQRRRDCSTSAAFCWVIWSSWMMAVADLADVARSVRRRRR